MMKLILSLIIGLNLAIIAMEEQNLVGEISGLPKELWVEIASYLSSSANAREAVKNITALGLTNKAMYDQLHDPIILAQIIKKIAQRFKVREKSIAALFGTPEAKEHFESLFAKYRASPKQAKEVVENILQRGNVLMLNYFIKNGIDINSISDRIGEDILKLTLSEGPSKEKSWGLVRFLIDKGASVNHQDNIGETILLDSIFQLPQDIKNIRYLIRHGADVNLPNRNTGETPLLRAINLVKVGQGGIDVVKLLLEKGAKITSSADFAAHTNAALSKLLAEYSNK